MTKIRHLTRVYKDTKSMKKLAIVLLLVLLTPAMSYAAGKDQQSGDVYTVFNLSRFNDITVLDSDGFSVGSKAFFTVQAGLDLSKYLAVEAHLGTTNEVEDDSTDTAGTTDIHTQLRTSFASVVARGNLRFDKTTLFGFIGMTYLDQHGSATFRDATTGTITGRVSIDESRSGATYGYGIDLFGNKTTAITLKFVKAFRATEDNDRDLNVTSLGITHYIE